MEFDQALPLMRRKGLTLIELAVAMCIIATLAGCFAIRLHGLLLYARQTAMQNELVALRTTVAYYRMVTGNYPQDLRQLVSKDLTRVASEGTIVPSVYLKACKLDAAGFVLDPFMNRYSYDSKDGVVHSQTKGYERW